VEKVFESPWTRKMRWYNEEERWIKEQGLRYFSSKVHDNGFDDHYINWETMEFIEVEIRWDFNGRYRIVVYKTTNPEEFGISVRFVCRIRDEEKTKDETCEEFEYDRKYIGKPRICQFCRYFDIKRWDSCV